MVTQLYTKIGGVVIFFVKAFNSNTLLEFSSYILDTTPNIRGGGVIYFPYKGETMNDMLDKISVLEEIKYEFYYNK